MARFMLPKEGKAKGIGNEQAHTVNIELIAHVGLIDNESSNTTGYYSIVFHFGPSFNTTWVYDTKKNRDEAWNDIRKAMGIF